MLSKEEQKNYEDAAIEYMLDKDDWRTEQAMLSFDEGERHIVANKGYCNVCKENLFSMRRHDYVVCSCGESALDGGTAYVRATGKVVLLTVYDTDPFEKVRQEFYRGGHGKDGKGVWRYTFLKDMEDSYLSAILAADYIPQWQKNLVNKEHFYRLQVEAQDFFNTLPKTGCDI